VKSDEFVGGCAGATSSGRDARARQTAPEAGDPQATPKKFKPLFGKGGIQFQLGQVFTTDNDRGDAFLP
jgi:hypothetical protein